MNKKLYTVRRPVLVAAIPPGKRKPRDFDVSMRFCFRLRHVTASEAPVAFVWCKRWGRGRELLRWFGGRLYEKHTTNISRQPDRHLRLKELDLLKNERDGMPDRLLPSGARVIGDNKREISNGLRKAAREFLVINGWLWRISSEPRYEVNTFGLGHNHGGTGLFVAQHYNSNIPGRNYFRADEWDKANAFKISTAKGRGDTKDARPEPEGRRIRVLIPEAVRLRRSRHKGDPFINQLNALSRSASSSTEAGIMGLALLANHI